MFHSSLLDVSRSRITEIVKSALSPKDIKVEPLPETLVATVQKRTTEERQRWWELGLKSISQGKLAVLLLAGGQGTRLGSNDPKGCFGIGLPSHKSLFQLQAERISRVQKLAGNLKGKQITIPWYIMTSPFTDTPTQCFFESHGYFGLHPEQIVFFQQETLPCVTKNGEFIFESASKLSRAPNGNGGVFSALKASDHLKNMAEKGVEYVDCYSVDNALVRVADPIFLGFCLDKGVACAAKTIQKKDPQEKVGVFVKRGMNGPVAVEEYSMLDPELAKSINQETGELSFKWSNVCMQMFSLDLMAQAADKLEYHVAEKTIPSVNGPVSGLKLEQFIFDAFLHAPSVAIFEVTRDDEFAPVKNASGTDSPDSARLLFMNQHYRWVVSAGGATNNDELGIEVSPLVSYAGEDLERLCFGKTFQVPYELNSHPH